MSPKPTLLIVGATGNTGRSVVETLSNLLQTNKTNTNFSNHRILALTRSSSSSAAQNLAKLPSVEVSETNWTDIDSTWFRSQNVVRAFIAPHTQPSAFSEESTFHLSALEAGVEYIVRVSTTAPNVTPDCKAYYARTHWAIETLLESPQFEKLKWTSLQPNIFTSFFLFTAVDWIKQFRKTGSQSEELKLVAAPDVPIGVIDADDVGILAAHLLVEQEVSKHNKAKYVLNGPEDITGHQVVKLVEEYTGVKVENVKFKDVSFVEYMAAGAGDVKKLVLSIKHAPETAWAGLCTASTTSKEVLELAAPKKTPAEVLKALLGE